MLRKILSRIFLVLINIVVFFAILAGIEVVYRGGFHSADVSPAVAIWQEFQPYVMASNPKSHYTVWWDEPRKKLMQADVFSNNYGYTTRKEFDNTSVYRKAPNEKVVLFTGGSTAWGVGASSNAAIVHEKLEALLNQAQSRTRYTVVNLAMGGWIAQQQAIALDYWGRLYNPDWIVSLDGANDSTVGCAMSQGTGNPVFFQLMKSYILGYLGTQQSPEFYRGSWENELVRYSAFYRHLTGKAYIPRMQELDKTFVASNMQVIVPTPLSAVRNQTDFYLLAEKSMLERFQDAKYILSTQPTAQDFDFMFGDFYKDGDTYTVDIERRKKFEDELNRWLDGYNPSESRCTAAPPVGSVAIRFVGAMGAIKLPDIVEQYRQSHRRDVEYFNMGVLFPKDVVKRQKYFIDNYHLNDAGLEMVARFYAHNILKRDFPDQDWSRLRQPALYFDNPS